jgi:hypothetical protein
MDINNIQVNCENLTSEQIHEMAKKVKVWNHTSALHRNLEYKYFTKFKSDDEWYIREFDKTKKTITFKEFMKLF